MILIDISFLDAIRRCLNQKGFSSKLLMIDKIPQSVLDNHAKDINNAFREFLCRQKEFHWKKIVI